MRRCFFLQRPRLELFQRIDLRVEQMVARGLLQVGCISTFWPCAATLIAILGGHVK